MTDDLVRRLRDLAEEWFEMCGDIHEPLYEASDRIEAQAAEIEKLRQPQTDALKAEIEWLKVQLSVESEPSPYCPVCGLCGDEGCCGPKRCLYPAAEWQSGYDAGIEAAINALEADAKLCDCAALEKRECACGAWWEFKSISSERAVEIVRALQEQSK